MREIEVIIIEFSKSLFLKNKLITNCYHSHAVWSRNRFIYGHVQQNCQTAARSNGLLRRSRILNIVVC